MVPPRPIMAPLAKILDLIARLARKPMPKACSARSCSDQYRRYHPASGSGAQPASLLPPGDRQDPDWPDGEGSCGTATAFRQTPVLTADIATDPLWGRATARRRSPPVCAPAGRPRFSPATNRYWAPSPSTTASRAPSSDDQRLIEVAVQLSRIAIERQHSADQLTHQAFFDRLTDLPNQALFGDRLSQALARARTRPASWPCSSSTWTASRRSMTAWATMWGTNCWSRSPSGYGTVRKVKTPSPVLAGMSSCCCGRRREPR